jgi:hypothetical protein
MYDKYKINLNLNIYIFDLKVFIIKILFIDKIYIMTNVKGYFF